MMSFGGGGGGYFNGGCTSSSSNLSALAPPFMVDRSSVQKPNSNPLVDLTEPHFAPPLNSSLHNWLGFDSMSVHCSNSYTPSYSPAAHMPSTDVYPYGQSSSDGTTPNLSEAKPCYPSYVSPTIHDDGPLTVPHQAAYDLLSTTNVATLNGSSSRDEYAQGLSNLKHTTGWGGSWEVLASWDHGKAKGDGGFISKDANAAGSFIYDYLNKGVHASKGLNTFEEAALCNNMLSWEKQGGFAGTDQFDHKSFAETIPEFIPSDYSRTSILGSSSLLSETYPQEPPQTVVNSMNCQIPYSASHEKCFRQHENNFDDSTVVMKSSPTLGIRVLTSGSKFASLSTSSLKDVNIGNDAPAHKDMTGISSSTLKDSLSLPSPQDNIQFDASQLYFHLKQSECISAELSPTQNKDLSGNKGTTKDALEHLYDGSSGLQVPNVNRHGFNLSFDTYEERNPFQNSSESLDSPCWKGAPVPCFPPFEASETVSSQLSKKPEAHSDLNFQVPQIFPLKVSNDAVKDPFQKPSENSLYHESGHLDNGLAPSPKRPVGGHIFFREHVSDGDMKAGLNYKKPNSDHGSESSYVIDESKNKYALLKRSIDESNFKSSHTMQQSPEAVILTPEKKWPSGTGDADLEMNIDDASEGGSSHVPIHAAEHVLCSPSSVEDNSAKLTKSHGGESPLNMYVQTLVNSMHNLSELLLFHCSNETCELKEEDCQVLKNVISNLDNCVVNAGRAASTQESIFPPQTTSQIFRESSGHQKGASEDRPQVTRVPSLNMPHLPDSELFQAEKKHYNEAAREEQETSEFVSVNSAADIVKYDQMTQAIRKILTENLHDEEEIQPQNMLYKNLWLEAEAALCSISYMARFNRMKIEIEKCKSQKAEGIATNVEKLSRSKASPDLSMASQVASVLNGGSTSDVHIQNYPGISISGHPDLCKVSHPNDIMARLSGLKCRVDNLNSRDTTGEESLSSTKVHSSLIEVDKLAPEAKSSPGPDNSIEDSSVSIKDGRAQNVEASVMARFHILKSRVDTSSSENRELQQQPEIVAERKRGPEVEDRVEDRFLDINVESASQHHIANHAGENSSVKGFHLCSKDEPVIPFNSSRRVGDQLAAGWNDSSSSDWEHVLKDELAGENC